MSLLINLKSESFKMKEKGDGLMSLANALLNEEYIIEDILTDDEELENFLFTLGCYKGEKITIVSKLNDSYVVSIKDARYSIDKDLASAIQV